MEEESFVQWADRVLNSHYYSEIRDIFNVMNPQWHAFEDYSNLVEELKELRPSINGFVVRSACSLIEQEVNLRKARSSEAWTVSKLLQTIKVKTPVKMTQRPLPLKDRKVEAQALRNFCLHNLRAYEKGSIRREDYRFATITSGTGSGKTRLCQEMASLVRSAREVPLRADETTLQLIMVHIDLSGGDQMSEFDHTQYETHPQAYADNFLGMRVAARALWGCPLNELRGYFESAGISNKLSLLTFSDVLRAIGAKHETTQQNPIGVILILDDFNHLLQYGSLAKDLIDTIGNFMADESKSSQREAGMILFPVITATAVTATQKLFTNSLWRNEVIPLGLITLKSAKEIWTERLPSKKHWLKNKRVLRLLLLCGSHPLTLRTILSYAGQCPDILTNDTLGSIIRKVQDHAVPMEKFISTGRNATKVSFVDVALAGLEANFKLEKYDWAVEYMLNNRYMLPFIELRETNRQWPTVDTYLLPVLGQEYYWSDFTSLEHALQGVRCWVFALLLEKGPMSLLELYKGAHHSKNVNATIHVDSTLACECVGKLLATETAKLNLEGGIKAYISGCNQETVLPENFFRFSFLTSPENALFDIIEFYKGKGSPVVVFKRMKHFANTENEKIIVPQIIEMWLSKMEHSTSELNGYDCYYMLITNKRVPSAEKLVNDHNRLLIVDSDKLVDYYGPTVASFVDLINLEETFE